MVATADELQDAIVAGEKNIQIRRHLDLRPGAATAPPTAFDANAPLPPVLGFIPPTVRTIRVRIHRMHACQAMCLTGTWGI